MQAASLLPPDAIQRILALHGEQGASWVRELPHRIDSLRERWGLVQIGSPFAGANAGFVAPARDGEGNERVLKLVPRPEWAVHEGIALLHWAGRGAVSVFAEDREHGALLIERALPGQSLSTLNATDDREATVQAARVIAELRGAEAAPPHDLPELEMWIEALEPRQASRRPAALLRASDRARNVAQDLLATGEHVVLHGDLQHDNILRAERAPWLAIDPKGVRGPGEAEAAALLRNPRKHVLTHAAATDLLSDRIDILSERLGDDPRLVVLWGHVLAVVAAAWAHEDAEEDTDADADGWLALADLLWQIARARRAA